VQVTNPDGSVVVIKTKARRKGKKNRKHERNYRYYGQTHSQTLYRSRGNREKNKARRAAQRERRLANRRGKDGIRKEYPQAEDAAHYPSGSGSGKREDQGWIGKDSGSESASQDRPR